MITKHSDFDDEIEQIYDLSDSPGRHSSKDEFDLLDRAIEEAEREEEAAIQPTMKTLRRSITRSAQRENNRHPSGGTAMGILPVRSASNLMVNLKVPKRTNYQV
jgi:hypothetical protein